MDTEAQARTQRQSRTVSITHDDPEVKQIPEQTWSEAYDKICQKHGTIGQEDCCCTCYKEPPPIQLIDKEPKVNAAVMQQVLEKREAELRQEFKETLEKETNYLRERFDFILQNEQVRASLKLREAHRERKEKIRVLTQQLECKNIAGMMYVMCAERARSKFEKKEIIEKYTNYINGLNEILAEGQELILNLSRGYKTAARLDYEWKEKTKKVIASFQNFIYHFTGNPPEQNQYFFDLPALLHTESPKEDNPNEDPIEEYDEEGGEGTYSYDPKDFPENKTWYQQLDETNRPFAVFGDMSEISPEDRRETLKKIRAAKTAPKKWKEYVFHDMFLKADCPNADFYKEDYLDNLPNAEDWQCAWMEGSDQPRRAGSISEGNNPSRRATIGSVDIRGGNMMGSILKIITASGIIGTLNQPVAKANLLGARDSMEIASTTKVRDQSRKSTDRSRQQPKKEAELKVGSRRTSFFDEQNLSAVVMPETKSLPEDKSILINRRESNGEKDGISQKPFVPPVPHPSKTDSRAVKKDESVHESHYEPSFDPSTTHPHPAEGTQRQDRLSISVQDSLTRVASHVPEKDHKINYGYGYERVCPIERCQRTNMQAFMKTLPAYMREPTFTHREQTFEKYETCTPEQLEVLRKHLDAAKKRRRTRPSTVSQDPLLEWKSSVEGIACQTSNLSYLDLPPCTCKESSIITEDVGAVYRLEDLIPVKQHLNRVQQRCLFDDQIEFNRFKVIGQDSSDSVRARNQINSLKMDFASSRMNEIKRILKEHPSLCDIFQSNLRC